MDYGARSVARSRANYHSCPALISVPVSGYDYWLVGVVRLDDAGLVFLCESGVYVTRLDGAL